VVRLLQKSTKAGRCLFLAGLVKLVCEEGCVIPDLVYIETKSSIHDTK
jgi:hypothetical protein